jgi:pimeloyl-ACP methyl ester carboxylesterase
MDGDTHENAPTQFVKMDGLQIAYRRFGPREGVPVLMLNYFAAHMDNWDPAITNGFAAEDDVILHDYPGIGGSTGETPHTVGAMTTQLVSFCRALDLKVFDVVGFSLGGMIAQQLVAEHPNMVRRIILLGTAPRGGEGLTFTDLSVDELNDEAGLLMKAFFTQSEASRAAAHAYLDRLKLRIRDRDAPVSMPPATAQLEAIREWGLVPAKDRYAMLRKIRQPTLIVHGSKDVVVGPINAFILSQHIPDARLIIYPDASHGVQSQYAEEFLAQVRRFRNGP